MIAKSSSKILDSIHTIFFWGGGLLKFVVELHIEYIIFFGFCDQMNFNLRFPEALEQVSFLTSFFPVTAEGL
jgi:hypothetical protein